MTQTAVPAILVTALCFAGWFRSTAVASTIPSLDATDAWLESRLPRSSYTELLDASAKLQPWLVTASYRIDRCNMSMATTTLANTIDFEFADNSPIYHLDFVSAVGRRFQYDDFADARGIVHTKAHFKLGDISPSNVKLTKEIRNRDTGLPPIFVTSGLLRFSFSDQVLAERVERAMLHAIRLCGGNPDLF